MKHLFLFMVMLVAFATSTTAQNQRMALKVTDGADLNVVLADSRFLFEGFKESQVFLKNSTTTNALMNYNLLSGEMMFIDKKGDTLALSNISDVAGILIDKHLFKYVSKRFLEVIASDVDTEIELLAKRVITQDAPVKYGAYGIASPTAGIDNKSSVSLGTGAGDAFTMDRNNMQADGSVSSSREIRFQRKDVYTLAKGRKMNNADKKGFLKVFSKHTNAIESYIEKSAIDFKNEQDILRLYKYCIELQEQSKKK